MLAMQNIYLGFGLMAVSNKQLKHVKCYTGVMNIPPIVYVTANKPGDGVKL
jgi:hypothetical protein